MRVKLIGFRAKDEAHLKDLDEAGLVTPDIEGVFHRFFAKGSRGSAPGSK